MKKRYFIVIIFVCFCILGVFLINKQNKESRKAGVLSHQEYYYDETDKIGEEEDGLTPIRSSTYEPVEER